MTIQRTSIGPLQALHSPPAGPEELTIVLFHGYGANAFDLAGLQQAIDAPPGTGWVFPEGQLSLGGPSRAWWNIDQAALEQSMITGNPRDLTGSPPPGVEPARAAAREFLEALAIPPQRLIVGGFSQGAMLTVHLTLDLEHPPSGLLLFSGNLLDRARIQELAPRHEGLRFFQSHGTRDPILSFEKARDQYELLTASGWQGEFQEFPGVHEIPQTAIAGANSLIARVNGAK